MGKFQKPVKDDISSKFQVNEEIKVFGNVRIVGEGVESKIIPIHEARKIAESMELDLVKVNGANGDVPIVKLCNFEKMIYEMKKNAKKSKQNAKPLKEVQLSVSISKHDMETKANNARKFLSEGSKVKVVLSMRGRELLRREENKKSILEFIDMLSDVAVPEAMPRDEGNRTSVILKKRN